VLLYPFLGCCSPLFAFLRSGSLGRFALSVLGAVHRFLLGSFSWFLFLSLVLLRSLVLRLLLLLLRGVLLLAPSWSRLLAVFRLSVVSVVRLWLVVGCGLRWLPLARLVCLWFLASVLAGVVPLLLVRSGLMLLRLFLLLLSRLLRLLIVCPLRSSLLLLAWLLRGVCLCLPNCFSSLLLLGWACFFFFQPPTKESAYVCF